MQGEPDRYVIISSSVKEWIKLPGKLDIHVDVVDDALEKTAQLIQQKQENLFILYFLPPKDIQLLDDFFYRYDREDIGYLIVIISKNGNNQYPTCDCSSVFMIYSSVITELEFHFLVDKAFADLKEAVHRKAKQREHMITLLDTWDDLQALIYIGRSLALEKDQDKLLRTILYLSKKITGADAGSIFIVEENEEGSKSLRFKYSHTFSKKLDYEEFSLSYDTSSIAGYAAVTGLVLNINDVYILDKKTPFSFNRSFDLSHNYRTKSMLVVPMRNHLNQIIGVIQLINCKKSRDDYFGDEAYEVVLGTRNDFENMVVSFDSRYESLMESVAGQAAIALENSRMIRQIENQFEEFVKASVTAIESRDPATSGHSFRVAEMCVNVAKAINRQTEGVFSNIHLSGTQISELRFAALLHDFGKVYIDPNIFLKAKKLYPKDFACLMLRLSFLYRSLQLKYAEQAKILNGDTKEDKKKQEKKLLDLDTVIQLIIEMNEPGVSTEDPEKMLDKIRAKKKVFKCIDLKGQVIPLLTEDEIRNLRIKKGSLNDEERGIIESHVEHTYNFVSKIPWPRELSDIPEIARKHHEKLDGSGYPAGCKGKESIPIQARLMVIADIFDALSAPDRPYKKALALDNVFEMLRDECAQGKLDADLVELFLRERLYTLRETKILT
jgi:HD-GYP domain-containing protein (c-di-GMP phosphodiesterase class II)